MAGSSMGTVATNAAAQAASNQDLSRQVSSISDGSESSKSEPEVASALGETKLATLGTPVTSSFAPGHSFPVPETPGVPLASNSSFLSFGGFNSQLDASISDAVPARGTPSAIGALKLHRHAAISFHPAATPFRNPKTGSSRVLHYSDTTSGDEVYGEAEEREQEEAQLALAVARAQRKVYNLEHQLVGARVEESESLGNLYRFRMQDTQRRVADANFDIGLIRRDISKNGVPFQSQHKRRRTSSSLHETYIAGMYLSQIVDSISLNCSPTADSGSSEP
ncbi:hypothetical protein EV363DRAFT_1157073 [Boletus edulis]|nr:hypothetical protein EV363DRAFT_1188240 [Boletus edulis]KAF8137697.1 hypothetical protein EV363DRAFT_1157073 [Boletus edulis]